jgi:hypothetical protein
VVVHGRKEQARKLDLLPSWPILSVSVRQLAMSVKTGRDSREVAIYCTSLSHSAGYAFHASS